MRDILTNDNGGILLVSGDINIADHDRSVTQTAMSRIMTDRGDFLPNASLGTDISSAIGMQVKQETIDYIKNNIQLALESDGFLGSNAYELDVVPMTNRQTVSIIFNYILANSESSFIIETNLITGEMKVVGK